MRHELIRLHGPGVHWLVTDVVVLVRQFQRGRGQAECPPHAAAGIVLVRILAPGVHLREVQRLAFLPPALRPRYVENVRGQYVILLVVGIHLADREHVRHDSHVSVWNPLRGPDRAGACGVRQNLKGPRLVGIAHDERLSRALERVWRPVKAVAGGQAAHELHGLARRAAPFHCQVGERVDAHEGLAHLSARLAANRRAPTASAETSAAGGLRDRNAMLVEDAIGAALVSKSMRHLLDIADGRRYVERGGVGVGPVVWTHSAAEVAGEGLRRVEDGPPRSGSVVPSWHVNQTGIVRRVAIIGMGNDDRAVPGGLFSRGEHRARLDKRRARSQALHRQ
mmetsp:Transcript_120690/g.341274  ORF Transcript_120690/g.341274 Transcript_120690/m.341274 type:complete len:337 (+) Transcript_120690:869-1879(+)